MNKIDKYLRENIILFLHSKDAVLLSVINSSWRNQIWSIKHSKKRWNINGIHFKKLCRTSCCICDAVSDKAFTSFYVNNRVQYVCLECE